MQDNDAFGDDNDQPLEDIGDIEIFEKEKKFPKSLISPSYAMKSNIRRIVMLYNPASGARRGEDIAHKACDMFGKHGVHVDSIELQKKGHAEELCRVNNCNRIVN